MEALKYQFYDFFYFRGPHNGVYIMSMYVYLSIWILGPLEIKYVVAIQYNYSIYYFVKM